MFDYGDKVYNKYTKETLIYIDEAETKGLCWTVKIDDKGNKTPYGYYSNIDDLIKSEI